MIGLCGLVHGQGDSISHEAIDRLIQASPAAGPEGLGRWLDGPAAMVRFHHATTPEAVGDTQPLMAPEPGLVLCFDGRLDNRDELQPAGHTHLHTAPDAQLVLHALAQDGEQALPRLVGDWALALWSPRTRKLLLARSPGGFRPLLWSLHQGRLAWASQPGTLINGLPLPRRLNQGAMAEYLGARFMSQTDTLWQDVHRLAPGTALSFEAGRLRQWTWHLGPFEDRGDHAWQDDIERFNALFDQALISTQRSLTATAAQLSGGVDSSSIVCRSAELARSGRLPSPPRPISIRYPGETYDETAYSQAVEAHQQVTAQALAGHVWSLDDTKAWCASTLHLPMRPNVMMATAPALLQAGIRVVLTGEGGDDWHHTAPAHWADLFAQGQWARLWAQSTGRPLARRLYRTVSLGLMPWLSASRREQLALPQLLGSGGPPPAWLRADFVRQTHLQDRWRESAQQALTTPLPTLAQRSRYGVYRLARKHVNVDSVFAYTDSLGIEARHPLHDLRLTHFLMGAPGDALTGKRLLREAMRGTLPESVRTRRDKANFVPIMVDFITRRLAERPLADMLPVQHGWVDPQPLIQGHEAMLSWCAQGQRGRPPSVPYGPVWFTVSADLWLEHALRL